MMNERQKKEVFDLIASMDPKTRTRLETICESLKNNENQEIKLFKEMTPEQKAQIANLFNVMSNKRAGSSGNEVSKSADHKSK